MSRRDEWATHAIDELAEENSKLRAEVARLTKERDGYRHKAEFSEHERQYHRTLRDAAAGNWWVWQGDGEDHLESLTCPVLIRPERLAETLMISAAATAEVERLKGALGPDASGRGFDELLMEAAAMACEMGGGPLEDCLRHKADQVAAALAPRSEGKRSMVGVEDGGFCNLAQPAPRAEECECVGGPFRDIRNDPLREPDYAEADSCGRRAIATNTCGMCGKPAPRADGRR